MRLFELVIVSCADSPSAICDGSRVAFTRGAAARAGSVTMKDAVMIASSSRPR